MKLRYSIKTQEDVSLLMHQNPCNTVDAAKEQNVIIGALGGITLVVHAFPLARKG